VSDVTTSEKAFNLTHQNVFTRVLWLYGFYSLLNMGSYLVGYYLLPEGFMRGSPQAAVGEFVASATSFWSEFWHIPSMTYFGGANAWNITWAVLNFIPATLLFTWLFNNTKGSLLLVTICFFTIAPS
jgi:hypothetical protein